MLDQWLIDVKASMLVGMAYGHMDGDGGGRLEFRYNIFDWFKYEWQGWVCVDNMSAWIEATWVMVKYWPYPHTFWGLSSDFGGNVDWKL